MLVNRVQLADVFAVSANTTTAWLRAGLPVVKRGGRGRGYVFDTGEVHRWLVNRAVTEAVTIPAVGEGTALDAERLRKIRAEADIMETKLAEQSGRLVRIEAVAGALSTVLQSVREKLLALPVKLAVKMAAARTREEARAALADGLNGALSELQVEAIARRDALRAEIEKEDEDDDAAA